MSPAQCRLYCSSCRLSREAAPLLTPPHTSQSLLAVGAHPAPGPSPPVRLQDIRHRAFVPGLAVARPQAVRVELGSDLRQRAPLGLEG